MCGVLLAPSAVGVIPTSTRQFRGAIDAIPVWGIVASEVVKSPRDAHFAKHSEIGGGIGPIGIEKGAVPVEEDAANRGIVVFGHNRKLILKRKEGRESAPRQTFAPLVARQARTPVGPKAAPGADRRHRRGGSR